MEKIRLDQAGQYQRNRERLLIKRREYFLANRELCDARVRAHRARLKEASIVQS